MNTQSVINNNFKLYIFNKSYICINVLFRYMYVGIEYLYLIDLKCSSCMFNSLLVLLLLLLIPAADGH